MASGVVWMSMRAPAGVARPRRPREVLLGTCLFDVALTGRGADRLHRKRRGTPGLTAEVCVQAGVGGQWRSAGRRSVHDLGVRPGKDQRDVPVAQPLDNVRGRPVRIPQADDHARTALLAIWQQAVTETSLHHCFLTPRRSRSARPGLPGLPAHYLHPARQVMPGLRGEGRQAQGRPPCTGPAMEGNTGSCVLPDHPWRRDRVAGGAGAGVG
jgi:hypothetical protein